MSDTRIAPLEPPYPAPTQKLFDLVMPDGMDPLLLFRTLATNERVFVQLSGQDQNLDLVPVVGRHPRCQKPGLVEQEAARLAAVVASRSSRWD